MKPTLSLREIINRTREREFGARYRSVLRIRGLRRVAVRYVHDGREWKRVEA